jgi:hypothetical protein
MDGFEFHVNDKVHNDPTRRLGEQVRLTMVMDHALTEAMHEIEELHRHYDEQERVIKGCDYLIAKLLAEDDNDNDSDSDSGPDYKEPRMALLRFQRRFLREMPLRSSRQLRRFHRRRRHTRWLSPRLPQRQHRSDFDASMCSWCKMSPRIP